MSIIDKAVEQLLHPRGKPAAPTGTPVVPLGQLSPETPSQVVSEAAAQRLNDVLRTDGRVTRRHVKLDLDRLRRNGFVIPGEPSMIAEEYRVIKRPILLNAFGKGADDRSNMVMVTSARPGEGKTFTAVNLALSMVSEQDYTVLLIDADAINPSVPKALGFEAGRGLIDVLAHDVDLSDVLVRTNIDKLTILPAGSKHSLANELLASARMKAFVDDVAARYKDRLIIFDSPPVLATMDPTVLALHVGQVAFVVEAQSTGRAAIEESMRILSNCRNLGVILNKSRRGKQGYDYGRYYYGTRA
jgi:protein-tyrosine kinase